jgi:hypothetical protein
MVVGFENSVDERFRPEDPDEWMDLTSRRSIAPNDPFFDLAEESMDELIDDEVLTRGGCSETEGRPISPNDDDNRVFRRDGVLNRSIEVSEATLTTCS